MTDHFIKKLLLLLMFKSSWLHLLFFISIFPYSLMYSTPYYQFNNRGYTLPRLAQRHADEEKLTHLFHGRISQLTETKALVKSFIKLSYQLLRLNHLRNESTLNQYYLNWRWSSREYQVSRYLQDQVFFMEHLGNKDVALANEENIRHIGYEMFLNFMSWIHLQDFHLYRPEDITKGLTFHTLYGGQLKSVQNLEIGVFAIYQNRFSMAVEWADYLRREDKEIRKTELKSLAETLFMVFAQQHNKVGWYAMMDLESRLEEYQKMIDFFSEPLRLPVSNSSRSIHNFPVSKSVQKITQRQVNFNFFKDLGSDAPVQEQFMNLCKGITYQSLEDQRKLRCYHDNKRNPYFYIRPLKIEHLADEPPLYQFYDVLDNKTIDWLKRRRAYDLEKREETCGLSQQCRLKKSTPNTIFRLGEMMTGLRFSRCPWHCHFTEYTCGRMAWTHSDHMAGRSKIEVEQENLDVWGDYLATMLYYLEVPQGGGETPFMTPGVVGRPVRGSAIFWYSMYRNGSLRFDAVHGSCPVLYGEKMITTHFFRYNVNWDRDKCTLNQME